jgi:methionyl-tRNA formyltransferase
MSIATLHGAWYQNFMNVKSVLFLGKSNDENCQKALQFCERNFETVTSFLGDWGDPIPPNAFAWKGDLIVSYLARWIVPASLLSQARYAINFHPASPEFPGVGCINFALYGNSKSFGATCHHMLSRVDTGAIIAVKRFEILDTDNVESLLERTHVTQLSLFFEVLNGVVAGKGLAASNEHWSRDPFTRKELDALMEITDDMPEEEIKRRTRAVTYKEWRPKKVSAKKEE